MIVDIPPSLSSLLQHSGELQLGSFSRFSCIGTRGGGGGGGGGEGGSSYVVELRGYTLCPLINSHRPR